MASIHFRPAPDEGAFPPAQTAPRDLPDVLHMPRLADREVFARGAVAAVRHVRASDAPFAAFANLPAAARSRLASSPEGWNWIAGLLEGAAHGNGTPHPGADPEERAGSQTLGSTRGSAERSAGIEAAPTPCDRRAGQGATRDPVGPTPGLLWAERALQAQIAHAPEVAAGWSRYLDFLARTNQPRKRAAVTALSRRARDLSTPHVRGPGPQPPDAAARVTPQPDVLADVPPDVTSVPPHAQDAHRVPSNAAHNDVPDAAAPCASRCSRPPPPPPPASALPGPPAAPAGREPSRGAAPSLPGSPPAQDSSAQHLAALPAPWHGVTVIVPVYGDPRSLAACLDALTQTGGRRPWRALLIDDASPDPAIADLLAERAGDGPFHLRRLTRNRGYIGAVAAALELATEGDVVLLNSDCVVPGGDWIDRLAAHAGDGIGTVTPLASDGQGFGFPLPFRSAPAFLGDRLARIDAAARHANAGRSVRMLTSIGFCTYVTRACLDATGGLSAEGLTAGYGEEVDFCLRASDAGLAHVAATDCFVTHLGSASFRAAKRALVRRNEAVLERRFPTYFARFAAQCAADPLRPARARIERALLDTDARKGGVALIGRDAAALAESRAAWQALQAGEPVRLIEVDALAAPATTARLTSPGLLWPQNISWRLPEDLSVLAADLAALGHPRVLVEPALAPLAAGWLGPQAFDLLPERAGETGGAAGPSHLPAELRAACDADGYAGLYL